MSALELNAALMCTPADWATEHASSARDPEQYTIAPLHQLAAQRFEMCAQVMAAQSKTIEQLLLDAKP